MTRDWAILGCGYVGQRLARSLLVDGQRVRACARHVDRLAPLESLGVELRALDAAKRYGCARALHGLAQPIVVYSIPPLPGLPAGEGARRAAHAARELGAAAFLYLSSTAVYGETPDGELVNEATPVALSDGQAASRIAEEGAVEIAALGGLRTVILRLAAIYGPGRGVRERLLSGNYQLVDEGTHFYSRVHVDDLVGILRIAAERAPRGAIYCVGDDRPTTQREYAVWLAHRLGVPLPPSVPSMGSGGPDAPGQVRRGVRNRRISNELLKRELDYRFRYPTYLEGELAIEAEKR